MLRAHSGGTQSVYKSARMQYQRFVNFYTQSGSGTSSIQEFFLLFIVFLSQVQNLSYNTIKSYSAGVRSWFVRSGRVDPGAHNGSTYTRLRMLLRGIKREACATKTRALRKPITIDKLGRVLEALQFLNISHIEKIRLRAAILVMFWGLFRCSEICKKSGDSGFLRRRELVVKCSVGKISYLKVVLRKSKTSQFNSRKVYIYANTPHLCAVRAVVEFYNLVKFCPETMTHAFALPGNDMSTTYFNTFFKQAVALAGLDPSAYSAHSLRAGGATSAANTGIPPYLIKKLGRWSSNCFEIYIREPKAAIYKAQTDMGKGHVD